MNGLNSSFGWDSHTQTVQMATRLETPVPVKSTPRPNPLFFQQAQSFSTKKVCTSSAVCFCVFLSVVFPFVFHEFSSPVIYGYPYIFLVHLVKNVGQMGKKMGQNPFVASIGLAWPFTYRTTLLWIGGKKKNRFQYPDRPLTKTLDPKFFSWFSGKLLVWSILLIFFIPFSKLLCYGAWTLRLCNQLAFDTPTGSVHVLESGGGLVSVGQLTGGRVWWPSWELLFYAVPYVFLSHLGSALHCFRRGFLPNSRPRHAATTQGNCTRLVTKEPSTETREGTS